MTSLLTKPISLNATVSPNRSTRRRRNRRAQSRLATALTKPVLPAAYASHVRSRFKITSRTADSVTVAGCDLVYPIPSSIQSGNNFIFAVIPANPAYWTGTRISQLSPAYMNYRPINMKFSYIPQVAVTQAGTVIMGTLWNGSATSSDLQQTLFTSNGGLMTQCYIPADTTIRLGSALPQNLFQLNGALRPESCPFLFVAAMRGSSTVPGYFYVTYTFELKNPIGQSWTYGRSDPTSKASQEMLNTSAVLLSELKVPGYGLLGPGTILDVDNEELSYHGTVISGSPTVQLFYNQQSSEPTNNTLGQISSLTLSGSSAGSNIAYYPEIEELTLAPGRYLVATGFASDLMILRFDVTSSAKLTNAGPAYVVSMPAATTAPTVHFLSGLLTVLSVRNDVVSRTFNNDIPLDSPIYYGYADVIYPRARISNGTKLESKHI